MVDQVGFIGLGVMGRPMALNLIKGGFQLNVYTRREESALPVKRFGGRLLASPREVAGQSEVVILMLTDGESLREVVHGEDGVLASGNQGLVVIDMSTVDPATSRELAAQLEEKGMDMLDAPVSGGEQGAKDGVLSIMVGGKIPVFRRMKPLLQMMGQCTYVGESGSGQVAKACNQALVSQTIVAVAETLLLAKAAGANPVLVKEALLAGSAASKILEVHGERMLKGDFQPGFRSRLHAKDLDIIHRLAGQSGISLDFTDAVAEVFRNIDPELDSSAAVNYFEDKFQIQVRASEADYKKIR